MSNKAPIVEWKKPESEPVVELGTEEYFWVAVQAHWDKSKPPVTHVFWLYIKTGH